MALCSSLALMASVRSVSTPNPSTRCSPNFNEEEPLLRVRMMLDKRIPSFPRKRESRVTQLRSESATEFLLLPE